MKTTRNKTASGGRSTLPVANRLPTRKPQGRKPPISRKSPSQNQRINLPALGNPRELVAQSYQETGSGETLARFTSLNPAKLEEMIQELSDLREALAPQVSSSIPAGKRLFVTPEPSWEISGEARDDGKVLLIRHPGIGWLGFIIPHDDCKRLAKKLTGKLG